MATSLLVVYKKQDEEVFNHLKELVSSYDDEDGKIVGTEDGTVRVLRCEEENWKRHKERGHAEKLADKFLFVGDVEGTSTGTPLFDKYGVSYFVDENKLYLSVSSNYKWTNEEYDTFISELKEVYNKEISQADNPQRKKIDKKTIRNSAMMVAGLTLFAPLAVYGAVMQGKEIKNAMNDSKNLRKQMLMYGISKIYYDSLDEFVKA